MSWFWGGSKKEEEEEEESSYEEYTDSEEEEEDDHDDHDEDDHHEEVEVDHHHEVEKESPRDDNDGDHVDQNKKNGDTTATNPGASKEEVVLLTDKNEDEKEQDKGSDGLVVTSEEEEGESSSSSDSSSSSSSSSSTLSSESSAERSDETDENIKKGIIPESVEVDSNVGGGGDDNNIIDRRDGSFREQGGGEGNNRGRADSQITIEDVISDVDDDESDNNKEENNNKEEDDDGDDNSSSSSAASSTTTSHDDEDDEGATSTAEKHSLLALACEHDRVDILNAILKDAAEEETAALLKCTTEKNNNTQVPSGIPPLHVAVSYGSVNATNCLLRMGADPSIRPDVTAIEKVRQEQQENNNNENNEANIRRFDGITAWELVFGDGSLNGGNNNSSGGSKRGGGWGLFSASSSNLDHDHTKDESEHSRRSRSSNNKPKKVIRPVQMQPSKREGIRHAFTAEALRCIGSDEVHRLTQLLDSGMPASIDIGGKHLYDWTVEMSAIQCEELLRPVEAARHGDVEGEVTEAQQDEKDDNTAENNNGEMPQRAIRSRVLDRGSEPGNESILQLINRLDELESLSMALSVSLDSLAEEVSVCNGLLLMGGGASALASHVRSLKATKDRKLEELERMGEAWENCQDELAYWVKEGGVQAKKIADKSFMTAPPGALRRRSSLNESNTPEEEEAQIRQLKAQVAASEQKILKLRSSIADLSEACARDLAEVEKRGLSGGIKLVRGLRDEIGEIDCHLSEAKSGEAACRTKISLIQSKIQAGKKHSGTAVSTSEANHTTGAAVSAAPAEQEPLLVGHTGNGNGVNDGSNRHENNNFATSSTAAKDPEKMTTSERIAAGQSTALAIRTDGEQGFFPLSLWQILLRIIGLPTATGGAGGGRSSAPVSGNSTMTPVMLV